MAEIIEGNDIIFKSYAPGDPSKNCGKGTSYTPSQGKTFDKVIQNSCFGGFMNSGFINIGFDDSEMYDRFITMATNNNWKCHARFNPASKHGQAIFRKPKDWNTTDGRDKSLAVGFVADIHSGNTYIPLQVMGVYRPVDYDIFENEDYDYVPKELYVIQTKSKFWNLGNGDGRNDSIRDLGLILQTQLGLSREECIPILKNTNNYVFAEPLNDKEFDEVTREELFDKEFFFVNGRFQHDKFAHYMKSEHHIKRINGQLHVYRNGMYISGHRYIENLMTQAIPSLKANQRAEVLKYLEVLIPDNESTITCENMIAFKNGIYDRKNDVLLPFNPEYVITNIIPWDYNPSAYDELTDKTMDKISCNDKAIRALLEECIGYTFYRKNNLQKSFILTGSGSNGKSTFLEMLKNLLGEFNISQLDIGELDDRFSTVMMYGKLANIGDDVSSDFLEGRTLAVFKKAVTGNGIKGEQKGQDGFFFKPYTKLIFSANSIPRMKSRGFDAIKRRILIIPFNARFNRDDPDYDYEIEDKLKTQSAMEYVIQLGLKGLDRVLKNKGFTESQKVQKEIDEFEKENNPILGWVDTLEDEEHLCMEDVTTLYGEYEGYCIRNGFKPLASNVFSKQLQAEKGLESYRRTINKRKITMYRKI